MSKTKDMNEQKRGKTINGWHDFFEIHRNGLKTLGTRNEFLFWFVSFYIQQRRSCKQTVSFWLEWLAEKHNNNSKDYRDIDQNRNECISWYYALAKNYQGGRISLDSVKVGRDEMTEIKKIAATIGFTRASQRDKVIRLLTLLYSKALLDGKIDLELSQAWFNKMGFRRRELNLFDPVRALIEAGLLAKVSSYEVGYKPITYRLLFVEKNDVLQQYYKLVNGE